MFVVEAVQSMVVCHSSPSRLRRGEYGFLLLTIHGGLQVYTIVLRVIHGAFGAYHLCLQQSH